MAEGLINDLHKQDWVGTAASSGTGYDIFTGLYGTNGDCIARFSIFFEIDRNSYESKQITIKVDKVSCYLDSGFDLGKPASINFTLYYGTTSHSFAVKNAGGTLWKKNEKITITIGSSKTIDNTGEDITCNASINIKNTNPEYEWTNNSKTFYFTQKNNRIPKYQEEITNISGTLEITSPINNGTYKPNSSIYMGWKGAKDGTNNPISAYEIFANGNKVETITDTSKNSTYVNTPTSGKKASYYVIAKASKNESTLTSDTVTINTYVGSEPNLNLSTSIQGYGTSGGTIHIVASYSDGENFEDGFIILPPGVTYNENNFIIIPAYSEEGYDITIGPNVESFSLTMKANHNEAGDSWQASSNTLQFELIRIAPNISSISTVPVYTDNSSVELYNELKLGRFFKTNAVIYGQSNVLLSCLTKWYVAHNVTRANVEAASYNSSISSLLTSNLVNDNLNVTSIVNSGEYFKFILYAENDGKIDTLSSEVFYCPAAPAIPTNFTIENIIGESATINNTTTLAITTNLDFNWTLNNRNEATKTNLDKLSYKSLKIQYSGKSSAIGSFDNWNTFENVTLPNTSISSTTTNLTKGYFYAFRLVVEDLEGITSTSNYITTFRSLGPAVTNLDINFQSNYNDFNAYKPLSKLENMYYDVSVSNNTGNLENNGLTYKVYGRQGIEDTLLFTYTCMEDGTTDKGFVLNGDNITFGGNNDTVIANLSGEIIKNYINSREVTDKNKRYTDYSFYILITDGYGEEVSFNIPFNVDYREAPTWQSGIINFPIGINYNINNTAAYEKMLTPLSITNDRLINFKEKIRFKLPVMSDLNRTSAQPIDNDIIKYRVSIARLNTKPEENPENSTTGYKQYNFSSLVDINKNSLKTTEEINGKTYYIYDFEFPQYTVNYFLVFKLEGIDTQNLISEPIYSNTYLVGCRIQPPILNLTSLETSEYTENDKVYFDELNLACNIVDNGGSRFNNSIYTYNDYNNLERIITDNDDYRIKLTLEISTDPNFTNVYTKSQYLTGGYDNNEYKPYSRLNLNNILINVRDLHIEKTSQIKLYLRGTLDYPLGYSSVQNKVLYNILNQSTLSNISQILTYFTEAPTVSYRKNRIGINTNEFIDRDLVVITESTGQNIIRLIGSTETGIPFEITLNLKTREIDGAVIDSGTW